MTTPAALPPEVRRELVELVGSLRYKPGWSLRLGGPAGSMFLATATSPDSSPPHDLRGTGHAWPLPDWITSPLRAPLRATHWRQQVVRWCYDRVLEAERHEAGEWFSFEGRRVFFPGHQGADPYLHREDFSGTSAETSSR